MASMDIEIRFSDTRVWLRTMIAAVALLDSVEDADPALITWAVADAAAEFRATFGPEAA